MTGDPVLTPISRPETSADADAVDDLQRMQHLARQRGGECVYAVHTKVDSRYRWCCARGHEWSAPAVDVIAGDWCPRCAFADRAKARRDAGPLSTGTAPSPTRASGGERPSTGRVNRRRRGLEPETAA